MIRLFFILFSFFLILGSGKSQRVTISEDINLRSDFLYDIMGKVGDKILLYRDKGNDRTLQIFDGNLWEKESVDLDFEKKRIDPVGLVAGNTDFCLFYNYREKGDQILAARKFDSGGQLMDTATIAVNNAILQYQKYFYAPSENKRFVVLFGFHKDNSIKLSLFDTRTMEVVFSNIYLFDFPFVRRDFRELLVTDQGGVFMIFEKEDFKFGKGDVMIEAYYLNQVNGQMVRQDISFGDKYVLDYSAQYDNINNKLKITGLFGDKFKNKADGFFYLLNGQFVFNYFSEELYAELEKNSKRKVSNLEDYHVVDCVLRADGGVILMTEFQREFRRRSTLAEGRAGGGVALNAYVDYYNEDMVFLAIHPDGSEHWFKVLRKKQFSQDDGALYSSFFVFKSAKELRIIFNDEIKQDNTVSEYIINPIGEFERNIVMNTEYQRLKLRFVDAIQISNKEFIVPSERNSKFNLVKVTF